MVFHDYVLDCLKRYPQLFSCKTDIQQAINIIFQTFDTGHFAQAAFTLGQEGDTLLCISTSGSSKNILLAAEAAKAKGMRTIGLTGNNSPLLSQLTDCCISVPETLVYKVQELHLPVYHTICRSVEDLFYDEPFDLDLP